MDEEVPTQVDAKPREIQRLQRFWRVIAGGAVTVVVLSLVAALAILLWLRPANAPQQLVSTDGWQTYTHPQNLFSIKIPADWSVQQDATSGTFGNNDGSYSYTGEAIWLGVPPQSLDGLGVFISVVPLTSDFARKWECQAFSPSLGQFFAPRYTLGGVPASLDGGDMWMVETHDAHFQINAHYPGGPQSPHSSPMMTSVPPAPTPVPADQLANGKQIISTVLASFTVTNPTPLSC